MPWLHCASIVVLNRSRRFPAITRRKGSARLGLQIESFVIKLNRWWTLPVSLGKEPHLPICLGSFQGSHLAEHCSRDFPRLPGRLILLGCSSSVSRGGCGDSRTCFLMSRVTQRDCQWGRIFNCPNFDMGFCSDYLKETDPLAVVQTSNLWVMDNWGY